MATKEEGNKPEQAEENVTLLCTPCQRKDRVTEAGNYCTDCQDYYCSTCVKCHEDFPFLSGHKIINTEDLKAGTLKAIPVVPTERCERHSFSLVVMYCKNHDDVGCNTCISVEHRSCKDIFYIPEFVKGDKDINDSHKIIQDLTRAGTDLATQIDSFKNEVKRLLDRKVEEVKKIKECRLEIDRRLDELERDTIDDIEKKYKDLIQKMEVDILTLSTFQQNVTSNEDDIAKAGSNIAQRFVSLKQGQRVTLKAMNCLEENTADYCRQEFVFEKNQQVLINLQQETHLGKINQHIALYKLSEKKVYNVKQESDENTCSIYSICIIPDGSVVLADYYNKRLKRLDKSSFTVKDVCELPRSPWQICTAEEEIAVSFGEVKNITFVTVNVNMKVAREMKIEHSCYGLAYNNSNLYVTDSDTTLYVYNMRGTKLKQFSKDHSGQALFKNIFSVVCSENGKKIYVADAKHGLVVLSCDGQLYGKYRAQKLDFARNVCEIRDGRVLVCGFSSNNIVQLSPNGELIGEVLLSEKGESGYRAVCFDRLHSRLIVGREKNDRIAIYDVA